METFILLIVVYPIIAAILGVLGAWIFKNMYMMPCIVALCSIVMMGTIYNLSFFTWVLVYTFLSLVSGGITRHLITNNKRGMTV
ncbi:hypothetical protein GCM10010954_25010 [Halobacillus andaensis]|uniref:DUF2651 domain-containing protein n=1 Tax=Halobacillus andaensis TaxID=1176239 RepID=A0A917B5C1_HALAA|nr:DUF2651 family protein [Halobacillus andaensis]MBP2005912.1 hypothetical protein [Halobacillus andaensis]GGF25123.1 hypothetical protein GCM10010954_25010 [Halobacillus andaensis]